MDNRSLSSLILNKAYELGADCAGIANVRDLKEAPAFVMMPKRPHIDRVGAIPYETGLPEGVVKWPEGIRSVLVIAVVRKYAPDRDQSRHQPVHQGRVPGGQVHSAELLR